MLDTVIIGAGLCGVSLARSLHQQGREFALYEARPRLGGRILSSICDRTGLTIDLGPTWFWPDTQPLVTQLIGDLKLAHFSQHDEGALLHLRDADKRPEAIEGQQVHNGAHRLEGGMSRLIETLAEELPRERLHFDHALVRLEDRGDHVALVFRAGASEVEVEARRVVLAVPPRLLEANVGFKPDLDDATRHAMREAATWMAAQAKVVISYERPFWREVGQSGNAFVSHDQAVLGEIFDACDASSTKAALGGFLAFTPELRQSFAVGLPLLMASQMSQVFGPSLEEGEQHFHDWAKEPYTCSPLDLEEPATEHTVASPLLRRPLWDNKLFLGSSETAVNASGYLEGALDAARRIQRALHRATSPKAASLPEPAALPGDNATSLAWFGEWVATQNDAALDGYRHRVNQGLSTQQREQLTQQAILGSVEEVFGNALGILKTLPFDTGGVAIERGRSALTPDVQKPFRDFIQTLLDDVIAFNRTSCALSNFPDEHKPSKEYVQTMMRDIAAAWQEFSLSANALLIAKATATQGNATRGGVASGSR
jgi:monoamine oxidase